MSSIYRFKTLNKKYIHVEIVVKQKPVRETNARPLANVSAFWAGREENWPVWVEFCIEHIWHICFRASAPKI